MYTIEALKCVLAPIAKRHGVKKLWLFGSVARGEAREDSDVDLLADVPKGWGLFALGSFYAAVEDALGCPVDLVTTGIEDQAFLESIRKDEVILYEQ